MGTNPGGVVGIYSERRVSPGYIWRSRQGCLCKARRDFQGQLLYLAVGFVFFVLFFVLFFLLQNSSGLPPFNGEVLCPEIASSSEDDRRNCVR